MTATPTPTPTITPMPPAENVLNSAAPKVGDQIEARFMLYESIERRFTVFAVIIMPDGKMLDVRTLGAPLAPLVKNANGLSAPFSYTLFSTMIPSAAPNGVYEIVTAFFDPTLPIWSRADAFLEVSASFTIAR